MSLLHNNFDILDLKLAYRIDDLFTVGWKIACIALKKEIIHILQSSNMIFCMANSNEKTKVCRKQLMIGGISFFKQ